MKEKVYSPFSLRPLRLRDDMFTAETQRTQRVKKTSFSDPHFSIFTPTLKGANRILYFRYYVKANVGNYTSA